MTREEIASVITDAARRGRRIRITFDKPVTTRVHPWRRGDTQPANVTQFSGQPEAGLIDFDVH